MNRIGSSNIAWRRLLSKPGNRSVSTVFSSSKRRKSSQFPPNSAASPRTRTRSFLQHAPRLRGEDLGLTQFTPARDGEQLVVRHARPQEVAQPAGQRVVRQRADLAAGLLHE